MRHIFEEEEEEEKGGEEEEKEDEKEEEGKEVEWKENYWCIRCVIWLRRNAVILGVVALKKITLYTSSHQPPYSKVRSLTII